MGCDDSGVKGDACELGNKLEDAAACRGTDCCAITELFMLGT